MKYILAFIVITVFTGNLVNASSLSISDHLNYQIASMQSLLTGQKREKSKIFEEGMRSANMEYLHIGRIFSSPEMLSAISRRYEKTLQKLKVSLYFANQKSRAIKHIINCSEQLSELINGARVYIDDRCLK